MIISRTPLRMSFAGGGSDLPDYYRKFGGAVVSTAIDKYIYVNVNQKFDQGIRVAYSKTEEVDSVDLIEHALVRAALKHLSINGGVEITTIADIPSRGTGLGSSSSFAVGLLHALHAFKGRYVSAETLGREACHIEIDLCGEPIGKQDQYAAACGGFNLIQFNPDDSVVASPIICDRATVQRLEDSLLLFYTGKTRSASRLLKSQSLELAVNKQKQKAMSRMVDLAYVLRDELHNNNVDALGDILHENWALKKTMGLGISNGAIDHWYELARKAGAGGGKLLGAGSGGFLLFAAPPDRHRAIQEALHDLRPFPIRFDPLGSRIIFFN